MADAEAEDGNDGEPTSPPRSKEASLEEFKSKSSTIESEPEEIFNSEDKEAGYDEDDEGEGGGGGEVGEVGEGGEGEGEGEGEEYGEFEDDGEAVESTEQIERSSIEKESDSASKLTATGGEEEEALKKKLKEQLQKGRRLKCGRQFREIIGKQELRKEELEKREGDLRQRLDVLECSMPAVMVWNVWQRMAQGGPVPNLHRLMEKQFRAPAAGEVCCPSTPSQHYDCRVREVEADRKEAERRLEEARELWLEKEARLKERKEKLAEAQRIQEERKEKVERLSKEAKELREALRKMDEDAAAEEEEETMVAGCESGECGDVQCCEKWFHKTGSLDSIKAMDVECLARLRELAENELMMKKQIAELERREETYMRTLQHADEMWSKMEGDTADSSLQEQLETKTNANQQLASRICELEDELEKLRARMAVCRSELAKYTSINTLESLIGREDDFAGTIDKMVGIHPKVAGKGVGREGDLADVLDKEISAKVDVKDREVQDEMRKYLAMLGSLEELYYDDDYGVCGPEAPCNEDSWLGTDDGFSMTDAGSTPAFSDRVPSFSGEDITSRMTPLEGITESGELEAIPEVDFQVTSEYDFTEEYKIPGEDYREAEEPGADYGEAEEPRADYEEAEEPEEAYEEMIEPEEAEEEVKEPEGEAPIEAEIDKENVTVPLSKLRSWVDTVDSIRLAISKSSSCSEMKSDADVLAEEIASYAGVEAKEVITEITPELAPKEEDVEVEEKAEIEPAVEPAVEPTAEPAVEPAVELAAEVKAEPSVEPTIEPADEAKVEPAVEPAAEVKVEPAAEPAVQAKVEPGVEPAVAVKVESAVEPPVEVKVESGVEPAALMKDKSADEPPVEVKVEPAIQPAVEAKVEPAEIERPEEVAEEEKIEKDIVPDEETTTILPIQKLPEEEVPLEEKEAAPAEAPEAEIKAEVVDEGAIEERIELERVEEIEVEKVLPIETEEAVYDTEAELAEEPIVAEEKEDIEDVPVKKEEPAELEPELVPEPEIEAEKIEPAEVPSAEEIFVDAEAEEPAKPAEPAEKIPEKIELKEEIPEEEKRVPEEKIEEEVSSICGECVPAICEEEVPSICRRLMEMEAREKEKEEKEEEMKEIEEIVEELVEITPEKLSRMGLPPPTPKEKPEIKEKARIPIDPQIVATPYLAVADIEEPEESEEAKKPPCVCKPVPETTQLPTLPAMQIVITQAETVQTVVNRGTQTWTVQITPIKPPGQRPIERETRDPEISARKMRWRMRPKDRSFIPCSSVCSQTEKPVSTLRSATQDPYPSEKQRLLSNFLKSLKSSQSTDEKEIRSINYGQRVTEKVHETDVCDCCVCGKEKISPRAPVTIGPKLPRTMPPKIDRITRDAKSRCEPPKAGIVEKQKTLPINLDNVSKGAKQVCDRAVCTCGPSDVKSKLRTSSKRPVKSEKKDQSCLAKLPKRKMRSVERIKNERPGISTCADMCTEEIRGATNSPSSCICTKTEKTPSGNIRKRQVCACGDSD